MTREDWAAYLYWRPRFAEAVDETLYPMPWLDERVWHGVAMFDHVERAAILSEWKVYPSGAKQLEGLVAAGDLDTIRTILIPLAEERARREGALATLISSREGWARTLSGDGYDIYQLSVRKSLV